MAAMKQQKKKSTMKAIYPMALVVNGTKRILTGLVVAGAVMFLPHDALAKQAGTSIHFTFKSAMTNTGVGPNASGNVSGNLNRQGNANNLRLKISLAKLDPNTAYRLVAYIDNDTNSTSVTEFTTNSKGAFAVTYVKKGWKVAGGKPLPDVLSPICIVRELDIVNGSGQTVLRSDLTDPDTLQYSVNSFMANTGFIPNAVGSLRLNATKHHTQFRLRALGLMPSTAYLLTINGNVAQTNTTDRAGKLNLTALPPGSTDVLDIHTLTLRDSNGSNVVLTTDGIGVPCDFTAPTVSSTIPANAATGVPINSQLAVTFSEAMNPATITNTTFTLHQGITTVTGTVSYVGVMAIFTPATALRTNTLYTATITTGATDLAGNALVSDFVWSFMTGASTDATRPTVSSTIPTNTATGVAINSKLAATFSKAMNPVTITNTTFTLEQGSTPVTGTVSYVGVTATFAPATNLTTNTLYTATITTGATDLAGNALATNFVWSFTTDASTDTNRPTVIATNPTNTATNVAINQTVNATFSKTMDPATITTANFTLTGPGATTVTGTVAYVAASKTATFTPESNLAPNTTYTNTITTGVKDLANNALATSFVWSFTTGTQIETNLMSINLGRASTFAIMATAAISGGGNDITGDVGLHPGSAQGIDPSEINGTIHVNDQAIIDAQADLLAAYNEAVSRSVNAQTLEGNLGGLTKTPGLYVNGSSTGISGTGANAILTLDAQGDANAVFIFKMASTLVTDPGTSIVLSGGAQAKNVYWQVGSSATLGTTSIFKGNILAAVTITVNNGTAVEGRLFAGSGGGEGAATVQSSTITVPAP
jgi:Ice-binding-like/Bacterial Ig-like domain